MTAAHIVSLGLGLILVGCAAHGDQSGVPQPQRRLDPVEAELYTVTRTSAMAHEEVIGTVEAHQQARIASKLPGTIITISVDLGDQVAAGQQLASIDAAEIRARLAQAVARRDQALTDLERYAELLRKQAVAQREYDTVATQAEVARQAVSEAEAMLAYATITAPFAGIVTSTPAEAGDLAMPGQTLLTLADPNELRLVADVPERMVTHIQTGDELTVLVGEERITAPVSEIAPTADPMSRTVQVKIDLPDHDALRIGRFARVLVPIGSREQIHIPAAALLQRGQLDMVFTAEDGVARMRLIRLGQRDQERISVLAGLTAGDRVLLDPPLLIVDGQALADAAGRADPPGDPGAP